MVEVIFAKRIKELREVKKLTQQQVGIAVGLTQRKISKLETMQLMPTPQVIVDLAKFFDVSTDYLLGIENW